MIRSNDQPAGADVAPGSTLNPGDEAAAGTPGTGEDVCPVCNGEGTRAGRPCANCGGTTELVVAVHGSARFFASYRDAFAPFCRAHDCIVLCPLFPAGVLGDRNPDGYKYLREGTIRYDDLLLAMVDEVAQQYGLDAR